MATALRDGIGLTWRTEGAVPVDVRLDEQVTLGGPGTLSLTLATEQALAEVDQLLAEVAEAVLNGRIYDESATARQLLVRLRRHRTLAAAAT